MRFMTYMQNTIYNLKSKIYLLGNSPSGPIPNPSTVTAAPLKAKGVLLHKPHTGPASMGGSHGALARPVSLGGASPSRTGMANLILFLDNPRTKNDS